MGCLDPTAIQGLVEGALTVSDRATAEAHLDTCNDCRRLVAALAPAVEPSGTTVGRYRLGEVLGRGGMGIVYKAVDPELRRDVAIKLLRPDLAASGEARLVREAQAMAQVAHPNVIAVYDVGTWHGQVFVAMELATNGTLRAWCDERPASAIVAAYVAAGRGLAAAHAAGLVHRDFKPDNVLVGADGRMRVTDFGLAAPHAAPHEGTPAQPSPLARLTQTGAVMGTPGYMAPEAYDARPVDARSDQFAFCVALWEALYRRRPFAGATEAELATAAQAGEIVDPPSMRGIPRRIERALRRGLAADPGARWPSLAALLAELEPPPHRARMLALAGGLAVAGIAVAIALRPGTTERDAAPAIDPATAHVIDAKLGAVQAALETGDFPAAERAATAAVATARTPEGRPRLVVALSMLGTTHGWMDDLDGAERSWREARQIAEAAGDDPLKALVSCYLAKILDRRGKHDEADDIRRLSFATLSRSSSDSARLTALEAEAEVTADLDGAVLLWNEALALRDAGNNAPWATSASGAVSARARNRKGLAIALVHAGKLDAAYDVLIRSLAMTVAHAGADRDAIAAQLVTELSLAFVELQRGHCRQAEHHARRSLAIGTDSLGPNEPLGPLSRRAIAQALLCAGERSAARDELERALVAFANRPLQGAVALEAFARQELDHGDPDAAIADARRALALPPAEAVQPPRLRVILAEALRAAHHDDEARELARELVHEAEPAIRAAAQRVLGEAPAATRPLFAGAINAWLEYPEPPLVH